MAKMTMGKLLRIQDAGPAQSGIGVSVREQGELSAAETGLLDSAGLLDRAPFQAWQVRGTNRQLAYSTHGIFRFFGKFPPPIANKLISDFTVPGDWVLDPMVGSGTSAVEAIALGRNVVARDLSPLSILLTKVKTTPFELVRLNEAFLRVEDRVKAGAIGGHSLPVLVGLRNASHWFLPQTMLTLGGIKRAIDAELEGPARDLLTAAFAATVRRVSRATTQQGRLFLDVEKAIEDAWPTFVSRYRQYAQSVSDLPVRNDVAIEIELRDATVRPANQQQFQLIIAHPPYFNNYKYSSINSLELAWLGYDHAAVRKNEIREFFKIGKPEKVAEYVSDLGEVLESLAAQISPRGRLALMMGDTLIRDSYIDVTARLLDEIDRRQIDLVLERVILRVPQYTEASWVASQRRRGDKVGVTLNDFILLFRRAGAK